MFTYILRIMEINISLKLRVIVQASILSQTYNLATILSKLSIKRVSLNSKLNLLKLKLQFLINQLLSKISQLLDFQYQVK
jgi:hypothetical protein